MALILSLDSTTSVCSVAIHQEGKLIGSNFNPDPRTAASQLGLMVKNLLNETRTDPKNISAVAVSSGPGSYTGLRIATSTAKGLCFALNIPLIAVNSLLVLTKQAIEIIEADLFCPMLDARRMEVYCALVNNKVEFVTNVEAKILDQDSFRDKLNNFRVAFFGDGSDKFKSIINHNNAVFVESIQPKANELGQLAFERFRNQQFEDIEAFEPFYLKDFMVKKKKTEFK